MKYLAIFLMIIISSIKCNAQKIDSLENVFRANILSPGVEIELPVNKNHSLAINTGITINGSYLALSYGAVSGWTYFIAPFLDVSYKKFYNLDKRIAKGKNVAGNSANFYSLKMLTNFKEIKAHNVMRKDNIDFAVGPTWGIQREYGKFHLLFDLGPVMYFDTKGNLGVFPLALQLNIGFDLKKW